MSFHLYKHYTTMTRTMKLAAYHVRLNSIFNSGHPFNVPHIPVYLDEIGQVVFIDLKTNVAYTDETKFCGYYNRYRELLFCNISAQEKSSWKYPINLAEQGELIRRHWGINQHKESYLDNVVDQSIHDLWDNGMNYWWKICVTTGPEKRIAFFNPTTKQYDNVHPYEMKYGTLIADMRANCIEELKHHHESDMVFLGRYWGINLDEEPYFKELIKESLDELQENDWVIAQYSPTPFYSRLQNTYDATYPFYKKYADKIEQIRATHQNSSTVVEEIIILSTVIAVAILILQVIILLCN